MHIEFLVEELSAEKFLNIIIPKIFGSNVTCNIHSFQGKSDLLKNLPSRLKGYSRWIPEDWKIVVLIDEDRKNCHELKNILEKAAQDARLIAKSTSIDGRFQVLNRIIIEELESWYFGDVNALSSAYPGISRNLDKKKNFRDPDRIRGGTWETLERVMQRAGYHEQGLNKIEAAETIATYMDPCLNKSHSFQVFFNGCKCL